MIVVFGAGTAEPRRRPAACCCSPTASSRPRCSWSSASSTTRPAPATSAGCPGSAAGWRPVVGDRRGRRGVDGRRARWPFGFVAKEADFEVVRRAAAFGGARVVLAGVVVGSVLTVAYSVRFVLGRVHRPARPTGRRPRRPSTRATARSASRSWLPAAVLAVVHASCSASCPPSSTASSAPPPRRSIRGRATVAPRGLARRQPRARAVGRRARRRRRCSSSARRPVGTRAGARGARIPSGADAYLRRLRGLNVRRRPGHRRSCQTGSLPDLRRRDPAHRRRRSRRGPAHSAAVWPGWPELRRHARPTCRSPPLIVGGALAAATRPPPLLGGAVPRRRRLRDGRPVRRRRARPTWRSPRSPSRRCRRCCSCSCCAACPTASSAGRAPRRRAVRIAVAAVVGGDRCSCFALAAGGARPADAGVRRDGRAGRARRRRPQRRQRDPRRLPRASTRSARSPCWRRRPIGTVALARAGAPAGRAVDRRPPSAAGQRGDRLVTRLVDRSTCRCGVVFHAVHGRLALPAVRRPQPARRRLRRRPRRRRGDLAALRRRRHRRGAPALPRSSRGRSSAPACSIAAVTGDRAAAARRARCSTSAKRRRVDLPLLGDGQGHHRRSSFDIGVYLVVVGLVLMVFESFGDDTPTPSGGAAVSVAAARPRPPRCSASAPTCVLQRKLSRDHHRPRRCSATAPTSLLVTGGRRGRAAARSGSGDARRLRRPAPAGARAHGDRHHASASPPSCSRSPTAAGCSPTTTRCRTTSRTASSGARASPTRRSSTRRPTHDRRRRPGPAVNALLAAPDPAAAARRGAVASSSAGPAPRSGSSASPMLSTVIVLSIVLLVDVDQRRHRRRSRPADWPAPLGITLVADRFSAIMLVRRLGRCCSPCSSTPSASRAPSATTSASSRCTWSSPPASSASFLTGDLFNLFVAFEMMLTASYVLITLGGRLDQVRSGMTYVVISLVASALFLTALALHLHGHRHGQHGRPRRAASPSCRPGVQSALRRAAARRVRHQGGAVPAVLLAARQLPDRAVAGDRDLRRAAHQGRRLRHHPHPDAAVPARQPGRPR